MQVIIDSETVVTMDNNYRMPGQLLRFLDNMDADMDNGIRLQGEQLDNPDKLQRARYVAMHLIISLQQDNSNMANTMCAYLVNRVPELEQVRAMNNGADVEMDLVFSGNN